jgi:hypothetical protein
MSLTSARDADPRTYTPREPGDSVLARLLDQHLDDFLEGVHQGEPAWRVPVFVERELRAIVDCGDYTKGFVLLACDGCRERRAVPFS